MGVWSRTAVAAAEFAGVHTQGPIAAANVHQAVFDAVRSGFTGRSVTLGQGEDAVRFTLSSLEASVGTLASAGGQADDVTVVAEEVVWRSWRCTRVSASLRNYHTRFGVRPIVVAAPIDVSAHLDADALDALMARAAPAYTCEISEGGDLRLRRSSHRKWGYVVVQAEVDNGTLVLRPVGLGRGGREWRTARRWVPVRPRLALPDQVRLIAVDVRPGALEVQLRVDEWTFDVMALLNLARRQR